MYCIPMHSATPLYEYGNWSSKKAFLVDSITTFYMHKQLNQHRADSRFAPSQWEMALLCNTISHWLGVTLELALQHITVGCFQITTNISMKCVFDSFIGNESILDLIISLCNQTPSHYLIFCWPTSGTWLSNQTLLKETMQLTHCGLVTPYGYMELGQHWLR